MSTSWDYKHLNNTPYIYFSDTHLILTLKFKVYIYYLEGQHIIIITNNNLYFNNSLHCKYNIT